MCYVRVETIMLILEPFYSCFFLGFIILLYLTHQGNIRSPWAVGLSLGVYGSSLISSTFISPDFFSPTILLFFHKQNTTD